MKRTISSIVNIILKEYKNKIDFRFTNDEVSYCYVPEKIIYIYSKGFLYPDQNFLFDLLHEIGHIETNVAGMKRCEEEFYATQWAIKKMKKYDCEISDLRKKEFQNYIWKWREIGMKLGGKNMPSKSQLALSW